MILFQTRCVWQIDMETERKRRNRLASVFFFFLARLTVVRWKKLLRGLTPFASYFSPLRCDADP